MFDISKSLGDFPLLSQYVAEACCIHLGEEKLYLFQARLGTIIAETHSQSIRETKTERIPPFAIFET
jgi:hypothetical protein